MNTKILLGLKRNQDDIDLPGATTYTEIDKLFNEICKETSKSRKKVIIATNNPSVSIGNIKRVSPKSLARKGKFIASAPSSPRGGVRNENPGKVSNKNDVTPSNNKNKVSWPADFVQPASSRNNPPEQMSPEELHLQ